MCNTIIDFHMEIVFSFNFCMLPKIEGVVSTLKKEFKVTLNLAIALILILNILILSN